MKKSCLSGFRLFTLTFVCMISVLILAGCGTEDSKSDAKQGELKLKDFYLYLVDDETERPVARITVNTTFTSEEQQKELQDLLDTKGRYALGEKLLQDYLDEYLPARFDGISYPVYYLDNVTDCKVTTHEQQWDRTMTLHKEFKLAGLEFEHDLEMKAAVPMENGQFSTRTSQLGINDNLPNIDGRLTMKYSGGGTHISQDGTAYYAEGKHTFADRIQADFCCYEVEVFADTAGFTFTADE